MNVRVSVLTIVIGLICYLALASSPLAGTQFSVSGKVVDASGDPVVGVLINHPEGATITDANGEYRFFLPQGTSGTVTAEFQGYVMHPGSRSIASIAKDLQGLDFVASRLQPVQPVASRSTIVSNTFQGSGTRSQPLQIGFVGAGWDVGMISWTASGSDALLNVYPESGTGPDQLYVWVDSETLAPGTYSYSVTITSPQAGSPLTIPVSTTIWQQGGDAQPFGAFDAPAGAQPLSGSVPLTGWALDDVGINSVKIYRQNGQQGEYLGDAVQVDGARPDVEGQYPDYHNYQAAGWGYMLLTNFLPNGGNGTYTLYAEATDSAGASTVLGSRTISVSNDTAVKPFGSIDTPAQGGYATGQSFENTGWALTPMPNSIPTTGGGINVYVDGAPAGQATYGIARTDIAEQFPGYANSSNAGALFHLDTTQYPDGVHTIQWTATDTADTTDGIGSRYFTIYNDSGSRPRNVGRSVRSAGSQDRLETSSRPDALGMVSMDLETVFDVSGGFFDGCLVIDGECMYLPVVARVSSDGQFTWDPGPAVHSGSRRFLFQHVNEAGQITERIVLVSLDSAKGAVPAVQLLLREQ